MKSLNEIRLQINEIDSEMSKLFTRRMKAVEEVAKIKKQLGMPVFDASREDEVIKKNSARIEDPELRSYYVSYIKYNMELSRKYQHKILEGMKIAYSGVKGAFANIAAEKIFTDGEAVAYPDFASAYNAVVDGDCDCAVLPIENSFAGDVEVVMDLAFSGPLYINGVYDLQVAHNLLVVPGVKLDDIKKVVSHPQALSQCAPFINEHGFETEAASNTAIAARILSESQSKDTAVIASSLTAKLYGLEVIERKINESNTNTTRFAVFSRVANKPSNSNDQFAMFFTVNNEAGSLGKAVSEIGRFGFNLRNLKSHPTKEHNWEYYFFAEGSGNIHDDNGKMMLEALQKNCSHLRVIGAYDSEKKLNGD